MTFQGTREVPNGTPNFGVFSQTYTVIHTRQNSHRGTWTLREIYPGKLCFVDVTGDLIPYDQVTLAKI